MSESFQENVTPYLVEQLRKQLAEKDEQIRRLSEENQQNFKLRLEIRERFLSLEKLLLDHKILMGNVVMPSADGKGVVVR